jgi:Natural resistance-associated macrophage protein-like
MTCPAATRPGRARSSSACEEIGNVVLGVIISIRGFVEVGSLSTSSQAGAQFGLRLLWAVALAAFILAMLTELCGRLAAVSGRSLASAVRERFGFHFQLVLLGAERVLDFLLLAAELGGVAIALQLLTGADFPGGFVPAASEASASAATPRAPTTSSPNASDISRRSIRKKASTPTTSRT